MMSDSKWTGLVLGLLAAGAAWTGPADAWITTKAKLALLTADGVGITAVNVDTVEGNVTLHGKVKTEAEKQRAEAAVRSVAGVRSLKNLLQVVPAELRQQVEMADAAIEAKVQTALEAEYGLQGVEVASVNDGVVLLSGTTSSLDRKLRAVETAWTVGGVKRVATEIETVEE